MYKRAFIFYLMILVIVFVATYFIGFSIGKETSYNGLDSSADVVTSKSDKDKADAEGYWVLSVKGVICVYRDDKKTLVAETDIDISFFDEKEKNILKNGIYFENAEELFKYLEANTS